MYFVNCFHFEGVVEFMGQVVILYTIIFVRNVFRVHSSTHFKHKSKDSMVIKQLLLETP